MPLLKCTQCHHEWESPKQRTYLCDWCGAPGKILVEKTPLELMCAEIEEVGFEKWMNIFKEKMKNEGNNL